MGERRCAYRVLVVIPEGKRQLGKPKRRWDNNIEMYLKEIGIEYVHWIDVAEDRGGGGPL
jgi:hypothetical protein